MRKLTLFLHPTRLLLHLHLIFLIEKCRKSLDNETDSALQIPMKRLINLRAIFLVLVLREMTGILMLRLSVDEHLLSNDFKVACKIF